MTDQPGTNTPTRGHGFCANCCYYDPLYGKTSDGVEVPPTVGGVCRRNAPTRVFDPSSLKLLQEPESISEPRPGVWPLTNPHDWCGEHPLRQAAARIAVEDLTTEMREKMRELNKLRRQAERKAEQQKGKPPAHNA